MGPSGEKISQYVGDGFCKHVGHRLSCQKRKDNMVPMSVVCASEIGLTKKSHTVRLSAPCNDGLKFCLNSKENSCRKPDFSLMGATGPSWGDLSALWNLCWTIYFDSQYTLLQTSGLDHPRSMINTKTSQQGLCTQWNKAVLQNRWSWIVLWVLQTRHRWHTCSK